MIKKFFQGLNNLQISYLLISGQASVFYGAATFSEDIDLWVEPTLDNWNRFLKFLTKINACVYKLTPPTLMEFVRKGHGFHFKLPSGEEPPYWFLDVMGVVPRVGGFKDCIKRSVYQKTGWGEISIIGIRNLVEIKKTRRLEDYSIISNLVKIEFENLIHKKTKFTDWKWLLTNSFEVEDILFYLSNHFSARRVVKKLERTGVTYCLKAIENPAKRESYIKSASQKIALEIEALRRRDRKYWEPVIKELKTMNKKKQLLVSGSKVPDSIK